MRVTVVGGTGFIGRHVLRALTEAGHRVRTVQRRPPREPLPGGVDLFTGDMTRAGSILPALEGADAVVHLAFSTVPVTSEQDRPGDVEYNVVGSVRVLDSCVAAGVARVLFASSGGTIYGRQERIPIGEDRAPAPMSAHGAMKLAIEHYLGAVRRSAGIETAILRIANAYGPGQDPTRPQGLVAVAADRIRRGEPIVLREDGTHVRDYVFVGDIARAFERAAVAPGPPEIVNIGTGVGTSTLQVIRRLEEILGRAARVEHADRAGPDVPANVLDISLARRALGWAPRTSLEVGLRATLGNPRSSEPS